MHSAGQQHDMHGLNNVCSARPHVKLSTDKPSQHYGNCNDDDDAIAMSQLQARSDCCSMHPRHSNYSNQVIIQSSTLFLGEQPSKQTYKSSALGQSNHIQSSRQVFWSCIMHVWSMVSTMSAVHGHMSNCLKIQTHHHDITLKQCCRNHAANALSRM